MPKELHYARPTLTKRRLPLVAIVTAAALLITGCTGTSDNPPQDVTLQEGGELVIGAEQEPDCTDWIAVCAGSIWGTWIMQIPTIPAVFQTRMVDGDWQPVPSDLMAEEPEAVTDGDGQVITYKLNPEAVWSDGEPITSADLAYTALQIRDGDDIFDKTGYDRIVDVQTPDATTAIVTLNTPYAGWRTLFTTYGVLPSHLLDGQDRATIMENGYEFSGGPWMIEQWDRGTSVTLVPNDNYWGEKPHLDKVTFTFLPDTTAAFQALKSGQIDALYPSPQVDALTQIDAGLPGIQSQVDSSTGNLEAIWINNRAFPFDSTAVRQALAYSIDRDAITTRLFGSLGIEEAQQSIITPLVGAYANDAFSQYSLDLEQVDDLMTGDGWEKNSDGIWEKDGAAASFDIHTLAGNKRRDLTVQILQSQLAEAGFTLGIQSVTPADLFGTIAPAGDFELGLWTLVDTFPDPTLSASFSSINIPTEANGFSGINFHGVNDPELDALLEEVDVQLDVDQRIAAAQEAGTIIADQVYALPIDVVPNVLLWNDKVGGPLAINGTEGPFWNLAEWGLVG